MECRDPQNWCHFSLGNSRPSNCYSNTCDKTQCHFLYSHHNTSCDKSNQHNSPSLSPPPKGETCVCWSFFVMRDLVTALCANAGFHPFVTLSLISAFFNVQWDISTTQIIPGNGSHPMRWLGLGDDRFHIGEGHRRSAFSTPFMGLVE